MAVTVQKLTAETVYIEHPKASYGTFCYTSIGDLFVNSDWGFFGYSWRAFNKDKGFKDFLASSNPDYIVGKFQINYSEVTGNKMPKHRTENLLILVREFIKALKSQTVENDFKPNSVRAEITTDGWKVYYTDNTNVTHIEAWNKTDGGFRNVAEFALPKRGTSLRDVAEALDTSAFSSICRVLNEIGD